MKKLLNVFINVGDRFEINESLTTKLKLLDSKVEVTIASDKNGDSYALENAEIIWGWLKDDQFAKAKNLKWLQLPSAGFDKHTDKRLYCNSDIRLTNSRGVYGVSMAEHVLGLIISFNRNLHHYARFQKEKHWSRMKPGKNIIGSTVGIVGLGDIGSEVAKRMHALGAIVIAVKRSPSETPEHVSELFFGEEGIDSLVKKSDYIILTLPITSKTKNIISEARLKSMKPGCFIVNVGRGTLIDQKALIKA
jgi:phosphoglycerate dehydrogenase-like enzyme